MTSREYYFLSALVCNGSKNRSNFRISVKFVDSCFAFVKCLRFDMNQISIDLIWFNIKTDTVNLIFSQGRSTNTNVLVKIVVHKA